MSAYDLAVIGGGPAGCAAAAAAARALPGAKILLLERGNYPRHKVCGEFVSAEALQVLRAIAPEQFLAGLIERAPRVMEYRLVANGSCASGTISPAALSVTRFDLDHALWQLCQSLGIDCRQGTAVQRVDGAGPFRISLGPATVEARAVVNASGRWSNLMSPTANKNGVSPKWIGMKAHYAEANPSASVDLYFFPRGYCGVQPIGSDRINACAMVSADAAHDMETMLRLNPQLWERSQKWKLLMPPVMTAPLVHERPLATDKGLFNVGDAAGFVDPFVGDGITLALQSGQLAGRCLAPFLSGDCSQSEAAERYRDQYEKELLPVFTRAAWLRKLLRMPAAIQAGALQAVRFPGMADYLARKTRSRFSTRSGCDG